MIVRQGQRVGIHRQRAGIFCFFIVTSHAVVPLAIFNDYGLLVCFWLVPTRDRGYNT